MTLPNFVGYAQKFCVALIAALGVAATAVADGTISTSEWVSIALAFIGAFGVYAATNTPIIKPEFGPEGK